MPATLDSTILAVTTRALLDAIRHRAARLLEEPEGGAVATFRAVERLMRMAIALAGAGSGVAPQVDVHGIPAPEGAGGVPEVLKVGLTDLLAARAAGQLHDALRGDPVALEALEREADRLLATEDIQLV